MDLNRWLLAVALALLSGLMVLGMVTELHIVFALPMFGLLVIAGAIVICSIQGAWHKIGWFFIVLAICAAVDKQLIPGEARVISFDTVSSVPTPENPLVVNRWHCTVNWGIALPCLITLILGIALVALPWPKWLQLGANKSQPSDQHQ